jgi:hypothetical protein
MSIQMAANARATTFRLKGVIGQLLWLSRPASDEAARRECDTAITCTSRRGIVSTLVISSANTEGHCLLHGLAVQADRMTQGDLDVN